MFDVRPRTIFKNEETEIWSMEYNYGNGFAAEDILVIHFRVNTEVVRAWLVVKDESLKSMEKYAACARAVIKDTDACDVQLYTLVNPHAADLSPKDLIMWIQQNPARRQEIDDLWNDIFVRLRDGWQNPILPEEKENIQNFSREVCKAINSGNFEKEDLLLIFHIISDLYLFSECIEAAELLELLLKSIQYDLSKS